MSGKVTIKANLFEDMDAVLDETVLNLLSEIGENAVSVAARDWVGWKYSGNYPAVQKGTSQASWFFQLMKPGEIEGVFVRGVSVQNNAEIKPRTDSFQPKAWGKPYGEKKPYSNKQVGKKYAALITRSGSKKPEWTVAKKKIEKEVIPVATKLLTKAIVDGWTGNTKSVNLRTNKKPGGEIRLFSVTTGKFK